MHGTTVDPDDYGDEVVRLYAENHSAPQIADITGLPVHRVREQLKRRGVQMRPARRSAKDEKLPAVLALLDQGLSQRQAAQQAGIPYQTVINWLRQEGHDTGASSPWAVRQREGTPEVVRRYEKGQPSEQIAKELGMGQHTVLKWLKDAGVAIRKPRGGTKPVKRDALLPEVLRLHEEGVTLGEIAKRVGASEGSVGQWLRQQGLKPHYVTQRREGTGWVERYADLRERALNMYRDGALPKEIATELSVHFDTVHSWVTAAGVRKEGGLFVRNAQLREKAIQLYVEYRMSIQGVCDAVGRSYPTVRAWLSEAGVEIRSSYDQKTPEQKVALVEAARRVNTGRARLADPRPPRQPASRPVSLQKKARPSRVCAAPACEQVIYSTNRKYCSDECRSEHAPVRQADPANHITFECQNCGKEKTVPRRYGAGKYCSNACANRHTKVRRNIVVREGDTVLDSRWEALVLGMCGLARLVCERFDRQNGVEWGNGQWYAPDFILPTLDLALEVKGVEDSEDELRWAAYREQRGQLAVVGEVELRALMASAADDKTALIARLREISGRPVVPLPKDA